MQLTVVRAQTINYIIVIIYLSHLALVITILLLQLFYNNFIIWYLIVIVYYYNLCVLFFISLLRQYIFVCFMAKLFFFGGV